MDAMIGTSAVVFSLLLAAAAALWGADSREGWTSAEWERRRDHHLAGKAQDAASQCVGADREEAAN